MNFTIKERKIKGRFVCDAELLGKDKKCFVGKPDSMVFENGQSQNGKISHSGAYSSKIDANLPFGMGIKFNGLEYGESFKASVWRKSGTKAGGGVVASCSNLFYYTDCQVVESGSDGWEKIQMEFFVKAELANLELIVYLYNPHENPVYYDDLEIIRYARPALWD